MDRYGHVTFCEDIRREFDGQFSLIGCYPFYMTAKSGLPYSIPKFCLDINFYAIKSRPIEKLEFQIFLPGNDGVPLKTFEPKRNIKIWEGDLEREDGTPRFIRQRSSVSFIGLTIEFEGIIKVFAVADDEKIRIGALSVVLPLPKQTKLKAV